MADPRPAWYDPTDSFIAPPTVFGTLIPGTQTAEVEIHLTNDAADVDPMRYPFITALARFPGETSFSQDNVVAAMSMVKVRVAGEVQLGVEEIAPQESVLTAVGRGRWLALLPIPALTARKVFVSLIPLPGIGASSVEIKLVVDYDSPALALDMGHAESGNQGVLTGYGDGLFTEIFTGAIVTESAVPDDNIVVGDIQGQWDGYPLVVLEHNETLDNLDAASAALAAGQEYWDTVVWDGFGVQHHKSAKGSSPLANSLRPRVGADERLIAYVRRKFSGVIANADIYQDDLRYGFFQYSFDGLNALLDPGQALVGNSLIYRATRLIAGLTDNTDNYIWLLSNGQLEINGGSRPASDRRALFMLYAQTSAGVVIASTDGRQWIGSQSFTWLEMRFSATLAIGNYSNEVVSPRPYDGYISFFQPPLLSLRGTGTGTGQTIIDIERSDDGGSTWTSIYTSAPSPDRRLTVLSAAANPIASNSVPEDLYVSPAHPRFRAKVIDVPGSTAPASAIVMLGIETVA